ncbi:hypothetical protein [Janibacter corallicola]|uniref:hypothetical protein n=1 Tax=Janibacter corallicola TaxID=415212 RepID=UPI000AC6C4A9|nr:hypothetical protein [Janibacter corallicola]
MGFATAAVVIVAVVYGVGFALFPVGEWSPGARRAYTLGGALLIAVLVILVFAVPW